MNLLEQTCSTLYYLVRIKIAFFSLADHADPADEFQEITHENFHPTQGSRVSNDLIYNGSRSGHGPMAV
jgi:hypothetical protein